MAIALALLVGGCGGPETPTKPAASVAVSTVAAPAGNAALASQRADAGIPDCEVPAPATSPVAGGLPSVVLPCLGSTRSVNLADLRGRPLVVNLWAQWCAPCRDEAPVLAQVARGRPEVAFLGIDYADPSPVAALDFARGAGWRYPHLADPDGVLRGRLGVPGIPVTLLVAPDGRVVHRVTGPVGSAAQLEALLAAKLGV